MKKIILAAFISSIVMGCNKMDIEMPSPPAPDRLAIESSVGIKLESPFVTSEVSMNVKSDITQTVSIRIYDISNRVVSKETVNVKAGDNILKVYSPDYNDCFQQT